MPTPTTAKLPAPKDWNEFEDMMAALLPKEWSTPNVTRHARSGLPQQGVDIYGRPKHLDGGYSGVQCKAVEELSFADIEEEVEKAKEFEPRLKEYIIATTAPADPGIQKKVRLMNANGSWPFPVEVWFWADISLKLSRYEDLLQQFYGDFLVRRSTREQVLSTLLQSAPEDFEFDGELALHYTRDVNLRLVLRDYDDLRHQEMDPDVEPWLKWFPAHGLSKAPAYKQEVYIWYGSTRVETLWFVSVDGARYLLPMPYACDDLRVDHLNYHVGLILEQACSGDFEDGFKRAGFRRVDVTKRSVRGLKEILGLS
jgi:hypothetical protein